MTMNHTHEVLEMTGSKEQALIFHLDARFYPPLHPGHRAEIIQAFKEHWAGELDDHEELAERCFMKDVDVLYNRFDCFLNEYDEYQ